jgi:hypothetical protein
MAKRKTETVKDVATVEAPLPSESIIQAEGEAHKLSDSPFPAEAQINPYGFLHFKKRWLEDLGWPVSTKETRVEVSLKIYKNPDGSITVRKV